MDNPNGMNRRLILKGGFAAGAASMGACARPLLSAGKPSTQTSYIAAYDTESDGCLDACKAIVAVHKRFAMPATFFIVAKKLEENAEAYRHLLDDPLFEVASHTYSHQMLRDHPMCGDQVSPEELRRQIIQSKASIENIFGRPCTGLRPACGFDNGLSGADDVLSLVAEAGYKYVSSLLWGADYSMPAQLVGPHNYAKDGFTDIWELPGHGWHENLLKDNNGWGAKRLALWPSPFPEAVPAGFVKIPDDEFQVNRVFLDRAVQTAQSFVSFIWHPWSLRRFDPEMKMLEATFSHVKKLGMRGSTYDALYRTTVQAHKGAAT